MPSDAVHHDPPRVLAPYVRVGVQDATLFLGFGSIRRSVRDRALWGPLVVPGATGCWDCQQLTARPPEDGAELADLVARVNGRYQAPSNGPVNMLASFLAALDVLRHLGGFGTPAALNRRVGVWSHDPALDRQAAERDPACATCADARPSSEGVR
ncbi:MULTISPECIES: hypothetical protein [unclassified Nocardiopsis]|uniref:hypothetical protein n=1 Tax=unclassified Nocardiopsis TaxID=2649073 RepID=UPI000ABAFD36